MNCAVKSFSITRREAKPGFLHESRCPAAQHFLTLESKHERSHHRQQNARRSAIWEKLNKMTTLNQVTSVRLSQSFSNFTNWNQLQGKRAKGVWSHLVTSKQCWRDFGNLLPQCDTWAVFTSLNRWVSINSRKSWEAELIS